MGWLFLLLIAALIALLSLGKTGKSRDVLPQDKTYYLWSPLFNKYLTYNPGVPLTSRLGFDGDVNSNISFLLTFNEMTWNYAYQAFGPETPDDIPPIRIFYQEYPSRGNYIQLPNGKYEVEFRVSPAIPPPPTTTTTTPPPFTLPAKGIVTGVNHAITWSGKVLNGNGVFVFPSNGMTTMLVRLEPTSPNTWVMKTTDNTRFFGIRSDGSTFTVATRQGGYFYDVINYQNTDRLRVGELGPGVDFYPVELPNDTPGGVDSIFRTNRSNIAYLKKDGKYLSNYPHRFQDVRPKTPFVQDNNKWFWQGQEVRYDPDAPYGPISLKPLPSDMEIEYVGFDYDKQPRAIPVWQWQNGTKAKIFAYPSGDALILSRGKILENGVYSEQFVMQENAATVEEVSLQLSDTVVGEIKRREDTGTYVWVELLT